MKAIPVLAIALILNVTSASARELCYVPYEQFETMVPHADISACPQGGLSISDHFCRVAVRGDAITLYTFEFVGENACLMSAEEMLFEDFKAKYGISYEYE